MNKYKMQLTNSQVCCKCGSNSIGKRFTEVKDTEDYHMHYDTLKCDACGYWDFPSAFDRVLIESDKSEVCPSCEAIGKVSLYSFDDYSGQIDLICTKCNKVASIENFVGQERWEQFVKECEDEEERDREKWVEYMMENEF